jgi:hypothetical protein
MKLFSLALRHPVNRRIFIICCSLAGLALLWYWSSRRIVDFTKEPLDRSRYLRDVSEPISFDSGISFDDGGSLGLVFKDSKQVKKAVCLENDLEGNQYLVLGSYTPDENKRVPMSGDEERAFLGLLQRWLRRDPEAQEWSDRLERGARPGKYGSIFKDDETQQQQAKGFAVGMLRRLLKRN